MTVQPDNRTTAQPDNLSYIAEALRPLAVPLTDLHEDPSNARIGHDIDMIAASLRQFGQRKPISVNRAQGNKIEAGNGTYRAAQKLGWSHIAAVFFDDDPATAAAYGIADNRVGEFSKWDPDTLEDVVKSAGELFTGFTPATLDDLLERKPEPKDAEPQIDRAAELQKKWQVDPGDLWQIGDHRLLCGDSTKREDVERLMDGEKARFEFSDPPYEIGTKGGGILGDKSHMKSISDADIDKFDASILKNLAADTSVFTCNKPLITSYVNFLNNARIVWDLAFWQKTNHVPNYGGHLETNIEYIFICGNQSPNQGLERDDYSKAFIANIEHGDFVSWEKPISLISKFIRLFSSERDIVIDRFSGSGTTLVACQNLARKGRAIEISPAYCAVTLERMQTAFPGIEIRKLP